MLSARLTRLLVGCAVVPLVLAMGACGGGSDDASPTTGAGSSSAAASESSGGGDFCTQLEAVWGKMSGNSPEQVLGKLQGLAAAAPDELKADVEAMVAQQQFLVDNKSDITASDEYMKLNAKNLEATKRVAQYLSQSC